MQFPLILVVFLIAITVVNGLAGANHWYWDYRWLDIPMHFAGGAWLAGFGVWWQYSRQGISESRFFKILGVCLVFALSIGLLWEAYEAVVSFLAGGYMNEMQDTIEDLLFDTIGSITIAILVFIRAKYKTTQIS